MSESAPAPEKSLYQLSLEKSIAEARARGEASQHDDRPRATLTLSDVRDAAKSGAIWGTLLAFVLTIGLAISAALVVGGVMYWVGGGR